MVFASWHRATQKPFGPGNVAMALIITTRKIFTDAHVAHIARERRDQLRRFDASAGVDGAVGVCACPALTMAERP